MSMNPPLDPRKGRSAGGRANSDEQYLQQVVGQPGVYQNPTTEVTRSVTTTPVEVNAVAPTTVAVRDRVRWGPILAGLVSTLATLILLSLLGVAVGLTAAAGDPNGGATVATNKANNYGTGAAIWAGVSALIAFFIGGFMAGRTAGVRGKLNGWINGALVWAIVLPLLLWLAGNGASGFLNAIGFNINGFINNVSSTVNNVNNGTTGAATTQTATETARNGAWGALAALLLGLIASGIGGLLGSRSHDDELTENDGVIR